MCTVAALGVSMEMGGFAHHMHHDVKKKKNTNRRGWMRLSEQRDAVKEPGGRAG